jgi:hypothetical protein
MMRHRENYDLEMIIKELISLIESESDYDEAKKSDTIDKLKSLLDEFNKQSDKATQMDFFNYVKRTLNLPNEFIHKFPEQATEWLPAATPFSEKIITIWMKLKEGLRCYSEYYIHKKTAIQTIAQLIETMAPASNSSQNNTKVTKIISEIEEILNSNNKIGRSNEEHENQEWQNIARFGKKPVHSIWFGQPPEKDSPHFGTDTLAASVYATSLEGDLDAQVNFWCLPEHAESYRHYFEQQELKIAVHTPNEIIFHLDILVQTQKKVRDLFETLGCEDNSKLKDILDHCKMAILHQQDIFNSDNLHQEDLTRNLSAGMAQIMEHLLDPKRRSIKDVVTIKDLFSYFLLATHGGFFADVTAVPKEDAFIIDEICDFSPIINVAKGRANCYAMVPDIFTLSCSTNKYSAQKTGMTKFLLGKLIDFCPNGKHANIFPEEDATGNLYYKKDDHEELLRTSAFTTILTDIEVSVTEPMVFITTNDGTQPDLHTYVQNASASGRLSSQHSLVTRSSDITLEFEFPGLPGQAWQKINKFFIGSHKPGGEQYNPTSKRNLSDELRDRLTPLQQTFLQQRKEYLLDQLKSRKKDTNPTSIFGTHCPGGGAKDNHASNSP